MNRISLVTSSVYNTYSLYIQDYRKILSEIFSSLQIKRDDYSLNYCYLHIDSVDDQIVQLLGVVMNLDLDTILSIVPNSTQIEVFMYFSILYTVYTI